MNSKLCESNNHVINSIIQNTNKNTNTNTKIPSKKHPLNFQMNKTHKPCTTRKDTNLIFLADQNNCSVCQSTNNIKYIYQINTQYPVYNQPVKNIN